MVHVPALPLQLQPLPHATNSTQSNRMRRQQAAPTATIQPSMPPSAPLVKPSRGGGLLSYIPTSISSILPARGCVDASPPSAPAPAPAPTEMSSPPGTTAKGGAAERAELSRVFQLLDRNGDGRITREELEDSLGKLGIPVPGDELAAMIARIDADGDGCVDEEEFGELYRAIMSTGGGGGGHEEKKGGAGGEEEEEEDMREAFRVFDANGDGYITVEELGAVLASLGLKQGRTPEECRRMIGQVDRDGDGRVDFHEFLQMMRGGGFAALG